MQGGRGETKNTSKDRVRQGGPTGFRHVVGKRLDT